MKHTVLGRILATIFLSASVAHGAAQTQAEIDDAGRWKVVKTRRLSEKEVRRREQ